MCRRCADESIEPRSPWRSMHGLVNIPGLVTISSIVFVGQCQRVHASVMFPVTLTMNRDLAGLHNWSNAASYSSSFTPTCLAISSTASFIIESGCTVNNKLQLSSSCEGSESPSWRMGLNGFHLWAQVVSSYCGSQGFFFQAVKHNSVTCTPYCNYIEYKGPVESYDVTSIFV